MYFPLNGDLFERPDGEAVPFSTDYGCSNEHSVLPSNCAIRSMPSRHYVPRWSEAVFAHWVYVRRDMVRCILHREDRKHQCRRAKILPVSSESPGRRRCSKFLSRGQSTNTSE